MMINKTRVLAATAALAMFAAAYPVVAASAVRANVPFAFEAGDLQLPAGHYVIERAASSHYIEISNLDKADTVMVPVISSGNIPAEKSPRLRFERVGNTYRLADVKVAGSIPSDSIAKTKKQALVAKDLGVTEIVEVALD
jgi:hypothetical protein